jgi:indolepyruvate ferredoxin oxidoreductase beta subunit
MKRTRKVTNILIVGVGGQGIILASEIIASVCLRANLDVKQSEVHGMAQRGGIVSSQVRFGDTVYSPTIEHGRADILLSFELLEALRWIDYLHPKGMMIVNNHRINPMTVADGEATYPDHIPEKLQQKCKHVIMVRGQDLARRAGHSKTVNVVLLGVLANYLAFNRQDWLEAIKNRLPAKVLDINLKAFELGNHIKK